MNMSVLIVLTILSIWHGHSRALLDQGIPSTPKLPADEAAYLHQIINQESAFKMELEKQITSLQSSVYSFQQEFLAMKTENNIIKENLSSVQHDVSRLKLENSALLRNMSTMNHFTGTVMFSAYLSTTINNLHFYQTITFDKTWTNTNNVYNTRSGIFTAPILGYYLFSLTITSHMFNTHVNLIYNGKGVVTLIADIHNANGYGRGSLTLIHQMNVGDNMWVSSNDDRINNRVIDIFGNCHTPTNRGRSFTNVSTVSYTLTYPHLQIYQKLLCDPELINKTILH